MMPIGFSALPTSRRSYGTAGLVLLCLAVFTYALMLRRAPQALFCSDLTESATALRASVGTVQGFACRWGAIPDDLLRGQDLVTLLTSVFVHTGWLHLLANLVFLVAFAPRVEDDLGHLGLLTLFMGAGVPAGVVHVLLQPQQTAPSIGASGGVAAVLGAHLLLAPRAEVRVLVGPVPVRLPTWFAIGMWAAVQLVYALIVLSRASAPAAVSYDVHVVGFVLGLLAVTVALIWRPGLRRWSPVPASQRSTTATNGPPPGG